VSDHIFNAERCSKEVRPILDLRFAGDCRAFARALARVLVRQELIFANAIPEGVDSENLPAVG